MTLPAAGGSKGPLAYLAPATPDGSSAVLSVLVFLGLLGLALVVLRPLFTVRTGAGGSRRWAASSHAGREPAAAPNGGQSAAPRSLAERVVQAPGTEARTTGSWNRPG